MIRTSTAPNPAAMAAAARSCAPRGHLGFSTDRNRVSGFMGAISATATFGWTDRQETAKRTPRWLNEPPT